MDIETDPSEPKKEIKASFVSILKSASNAALLNPAGAIDNLIDAAINLKDKNLSSAQRAHAFWKVSMVYAVMGVFKDENIADLKTEHKEIAHKLSDFPELMTAPSVFSETEIDNPLKFKPYQELRSLFPEMIRCINSDYKIEELKIKTKLDQAYKNGLEKTFSSESFAPFRDEINSLYKGPFPETFKRWSAWKKHYKWIYKCLFEDCLFGQEETGITISDVYVPLRGVFKHEIEETEPSSAIKQVTREIHICDLQDALTDWLENLNNSSTAHDTIRLIGGSLGSGKSVFSKFFAHHVAKETDWNMIYVDLQHLLHPEKPLQERLQLYLDGKTEAWEEKVDILSSIRKDDDPTLLIFDGLDELYAEGEQATELAVSLVKKLKNSLLHELNQSSLKAAAVVLGRTSAVNFAKAANDLLVNSSYSVMPLCGLSDEHLQLDKSKAENRSELIEIIDPKELRDTDQRKDYWEKWQTIDPTLDEIKEDILKIKNLIYLTAEPLLFYLLVLSDHLQKSDDLSKISRNSLYKDLFIEIYKRDREKRGGNRHPASQNLKNSADFLHLMECLGLAVWQGGGSTGSKKHFEKYRDLHAFENKEKFRKRSFASIKNVALQFYVKNKRSDNKDFEFVHKSFGEYLSARTILRAAENFLSSEKLEPEEFALLWQNHFSATIITKEILDFLIDEAQINFKDDVKKAEHLVSELTICLNWLLRNGFPSYRLQDIKNWYHLEEKQKNSWNAFLSMMSALTICLNETRGEAFLIRPDWQDWNNARWLIDKLDLPHENFNSLARIFNYWDFSDQNLTSLNLSYLGLINSQFENADLRRVDLRRANLWRANLCNSDLKGADLGVTDLEHANLRRAILYDANLCEADLRRANLSNAQLRNANLWGANLGRVDLAGANLSGADIKHANLWRANLSNADIKGASTAYSSLISTYLSECYNLSQSQINIAFGDSATSLRTDLSRPNHWHPEILGSEAADVEWKEWFKKQKTSF